MLTAVGADFVDDEPVATRPDAEDALRIAYRGAVLRLAARDLTGSVEVSDVAAELADLAAGDPGGSAGRRQGRPAR